MYTCYSLPELLALAGYLALAASAHPGDAALALQAHDARVAFERACSRKEGR